MRRLFPFFAAWLIGASSLAAAPAGDLVGSNAILVLPFVAPAGADTWIGKAVQQDLLTDLSQGTTARVLAPADTAPAADPAAARKAAQDAGAALVIFGQVQTSGGQIRLSGQVLDAATGQPLGNLKATGSAGDLFHLEDGLAGQTLAAVPRSMLTAQALAAEQQTQPAARQQPLAVQPPAPQQRGDYSVTTQGPGYSAPAVADTYAPPPASAYVYDTARPTYTYNYYEPAPAYGFGYPVPAYTYGCPSFDLFPFWGPFLSFGLDFDNFHHFRGRDFDGDWHNGWFHGEGHGNGLGPTGRTGVAGSRFGTSTAGSSTFARTGAPRAFQSRGGFVTGGSPARSYNGTPSMARGSVSGLRARSFDGSQSFSGPRFYGGGNASGFRGTSGGSRGMSGGGFRGGISGGYRGGIGGGFHSGGGGGFGGGVHGGGGGGRR